MFCSSLDSCLYSWHYYVFQLQIWDTAGQERFRSITQSYYRSANALILTYDITCEDSFRCLPEWLREIEQYANNQVVTILVGKNFVLYLNNSCLSLSSALFGKIYLFLFLSFWERSLLKCIPHMLACTYPSPFSSVSLNTHYCLVRLQQARLVVCFCLVLFPLLLTNGHCMFILGNKIDLAEKREVLRQRAEDFAEAQSMLYLETSAKESDNVEKLFLDLACELIREAKQNKLDNSDTAPMPGEGKTISYLSCCNIN